MSKEIKKEKLDNVTKWFCIISLIIIYHGILLVLFYPDEQYCKECDKRSYRKSLYEHVNHRQYPQRRKPSKTISTEIKIVKTCVTAPKFERRKIDRRTAPEQREF